MIKTTIKILISLSIITTLSIAQKEALIVGVSDYARTKDDLQGIEIDINNMKNLFEKWGFKYTHLNQIRAKKLVIFDSCHSGTVFKKLPPRGKHGIYYSLC